MSSAPVATGLPYSDVVPDDVQHKPDSKARWRARYIWDTLDKDPKERWFLFKLDAVLLTLASLGYFIKVTHLLVRMTGIRLTTHHIESGSNECDECICLWDERATSYEWQRL